MAGVTIQINGEERTVQSETVLALLRELGLQEKKIAIERNRAIVPRSVYASTTLQSGDAIEIVSFVGGG